jgi:hypothetical protein
MHTIRPELLGYSVIGRVPPHPPPSREETERRCHQESQLRGDAHQEIKLRGDAIAPPCPPRAMMVPTRRGRRVMGKDTRARGTATVRKTLPPNPTHDRPAGETVLSLILCHKTVLRGETVLSLMLWHRHHAIAGGHDI